MFTILDGSHYQKSKKKTVIITHTVNIETCKKNPTKFGSIFNFNIMLAILGSSH